ncbi:MAG: UDP-N-acetylmuramoyl-L-alanine--D-glutamate ligase [Bacteroidia bacterium]|nr:UDP-N-acetylmuramoyl-L-alanine--D-glutamate ligase [Bacteroidia bacterium]
MSGNIKILGGGESGTGAALLAKTKGFNVFVSDSNFIKPKYKELLIKYAIPFEEGSHNKEIILSADEIIASPGIPENAEIIKLIRERGINIISEIEFAGRYTKAKKICITGSNGKTTTTLLTYHILKKAGLNVGLAGNVGNSFALQVAQNDYEYYVIELSSFQLDGMYKFKAEMGVLMNITPDHLDRYDYSFQKYIDSKFRILQNQTQDDYFIYCADDDVIIKEMEKHKIISKQIPFSLHKKFVQGAYIDDNQIIVNLTNNRFTMSIFELSLQGNHNAYNSMAAAIVASSLWIRKSVIRNSLSDFQGVEHRLEPVIKVRGIQFINDSKATNINSTWYAMETIPKPIIWIVGGVDKGNDYSMLMDSVKQKVKVIICLGKDNSKIHNAFDGVIKTIFDTTAMAEAVRTAYYHGQKGDNVLLSPACASFDLFQDYEDRGYQFKAAVREL